MRRKDVEKSPIIYKRYQSFEFLALCGVAMAILPIVDDRDLFVRSGVCFHSTGGPPNIVVAPVLTSFSNPELCPAFKTFSPISMDSVFHVVSLLRYPLGVFVAL